MANFVFANNREISCKAGNGKSICAFPDVCFTPPENPTTPIGVPVPYPNTGKDDNTTSGSKNVKISSNEVMLKNISYFKKSIGNEAGSTAKKGIITGTNKGKVYFISWSMDVKFEGENVVRHLDLTTHNHNPSTPNTPPSPLTSRKAIADRSGACSEAIKNYKDACKGKEGKQISCPCHTEGKAVKKNTELRDGIKENIKRMPKSWGYMTKSGNVSAKYKRNYSDYSDANDSVKNSYNEYAKCMNKKKANKCQQAAKCMLSIKDPNTCCEPQTPHHVVAGASFRKSGTKIPYTQKVASYNYDKAPCICAEGNSQHVGTHGGLHWRTKQIAKQKYGNKKTWKVKEAEEVGAEAVCKEFPQCKKNDDDNACDCIKQQIRQRHEEMGIGENETIRLTLPAPKTHPMENVNF